MVEVAKGDALGLAGSVLDRKYRVDAQVAEGGFGIVFAGWHIALGVKVAIKVPKRPDDTYDDDWSDMLGKFLDEARLAAKLRHPAVVSIFDSGITPTDAHPEGVAWIAMEWLDGETLTADLRQRRARGDHGRTRTETLQLMRPVIDAIAEAHHAGIAHRDFNPNNVMLVPGRAAISARVLDFGIAKTMSAHAAPGEQTTSPAADRAFSFAYAAPEQISGARTGPWTDVHALGLVLTELLCDRPALPADVDAHYRAVFSPARPTPAALGIDAGPWEPVLARALALDARERYPSAGELLTALDAATAPPPEPAVPPEPAPRRTPWPLVAVPATALAIGLGIWIVQRGPAEPERPPPPPASCTSNAACSRPGEPAVCRPGVGCVALRSPDCEPLGDANAIASDATVWIGALAPRSGLDGTWGAREVNAIDLARRDFAQVMAGANAGDRARPFGVLACDDVVDAPRAARHLVEAGVPAVIGMSNAEQAIDLATSLFLPHRILVVASITTNPLVTAIPQPTGMPRLVWRTTNTSTDSAAAIATWIASDLDARLRLPGHELRIALVRSSNANGDALGAAFLAKLRFNDRSTLDNRGNYRDLTIDPQAADREYRRIYPELLAFAPDIIIYAANVPIIGALFAPLEDNWPVGVRRPRYISVAAPPKELLRFIADDRDRRGRFFGVTPVSSTIANLRLVTHYNGAFPGDQITRTINPNSSYDAFYVVAYASYGVPGTQPVTGDRLARAIRLLVPPGPPVEVGIAGIFEAYAALRADRAIDLSGATGRLDFDLATGESAFDHAILCAGPDESGTLDGVESGLVYSASTGRLTGAMRCP